MLNCPLNIYPLTHIVKDLPIFFTESSKNCQRWPTPKKVNISEYLIFLCKWKVKKK